MTLEEAKQLKPGDVITGGWNRNGGHERTIASCHMTDESQLTWKEPGSDTNHYYEIRTIVLVKAAAPAIINDYSIY